MRLDLFRPESFRPLDGVSVIEAAEDSRRAGLAFMNAVCEGYDPWDLARWLAGPYRRATRHGSWRTPEVADLLERTMCHFEDDLGATRETVLGMLERMAEGSVRIRFVESAQVQGLVVPCLSDGARGWVPIESVANGLAGLVAALFVADYLVRPLDYCNLMLICPRCTAVVFDRIANRRGECGQHERAPASPGTTVRMRETANPRLELCPASSR
jgi:hypothetical protein